VYYKEKKGTKSNLQVVLWIRIGFNADLNTDADPDPDPRFWWPKKGKNLQLKKLKLTYP
jgi:hypothetical protein